MLSHSHLMIQGAVGRAVAPMPWFPRSPVVFPRNPRGYSENQWRKSFYLAGFLLFQTDVSCVHWIWSFEHMFYDLDSVCCSKIIYGPMVKHGQRHANLV